MTSEPRDLRSGATLLRSSCEAAGVTRLRTVRLLPMALALLVGVGCTSEPGDGSASASRSPAVTPAVAARLEPSCPPAPESPVGVASAEAGTPSWLRRTYRRGMRPTRCQHAAGRRPGVWVFGDTLRSGRTPAIVANSMLVSGGHCASQLFRPRTGPSSPMPRLTPCTGRCQPCPGPTESTSDSWCCARGFFGVAPGRCSTSRSWGPPWRCSVSPRAAYRNCAVVRITEDNPDPHRSTGVPPASRRPLDLRVRHSAHG